MNQEMQRSFEEANSRVANDATDTGRGQPVAHRKPSIRVRLLNRFLRWTIKKHMSNAELTPAEIGKTRKRMDRMGLAGAARKTSKVKFETGELGGVPLCWAEPKRGGSGPRPVVLHFHGGAYFVGSSKAYRPFAANLALLADARVAMLDYGLAPEAPYPAATNDALAAYRALLQQGIPAQRIVLGGDSAGGNLALVTLLKIKEARLPTPAGCLLLSPWADLTGSGESIKTNAEADAMLPGHRMPEAAYLYAGENDLRNWRISPLFGNYEGLPPLSIHVGSEEILRDDSRRVAACAAEAGVEVVLTEWPQAPHVFPIFSDLIPEGKRAMVLIADWIASVLPDRGAIDAALGPRHPPTRSPATSESSH